MEVKAECVDKNCPIHGTLSVRGRTFEGRVVSDKMQRTVVVELEHMYKVAKYERYERRTSRHAAHNPPCVNARAGDKVEIAECRRLSKTVSFVVMRKLEG